jgi:hypothetical protein
MLFTQAASQAKSPLAPPLVKGGLGGFAGVVPHCPTLCERYWGYIHDQLVGNPDRLRLASFITEADVCDVAAGIIQVRFLHPISSSAMSPSAHAKLTASTARFVAKLFR